MSVTVHDHLTEFRYEARLGSTLAGTTGYELTDSKIIFTHTVVAEGFEGQGVGGALARFALDDARSRGLRVRPDCPFIRRWIERHPEYADLVD
jgi:predicted GNAT family acetyltransferase